MKAVIIDDNEKARVALKSDLEDYCEQIKVIGEAEGVVSGLNTLSFLNPDVLFLDIRMGDGTGFDLLSKLNERGKVNFKVIFTTAYDEYAIKAFKFAAIDYLLKPIDPDDLIQSVNKLNPKVLLPSLDQFELLFNQLNKKVIKKISLAEQDRIHLIDIQDIIRCEADKNYTVFYLVDNRKIVVSKTLKEFENILSEHNFYRTHHAHLVNLNQIKEFVKLDGPYVLMLNGMQVPVSSRKKEGFIQALNGGL